MLIRAGPLGKVLCNLKYYAIRVEFQFRGLPHIHSFLWIPNESTLNENSINEHDGFLDSVVRGNVPSKQKNCHLHQLVMTFQIHYHSKTFGKYTNIKFHFKFHCFFTEKIIVPKPLQNILSQIEKFEIVNKKAILYAR